MARDGAAADRRQRATASASSSIATTTRTVCGERNAVAPEPAYASTTRVGACERARSSTYAAARRHARVHLHERRAAAATPPLVRRASLRAVLGLPPERRDRRHGVEERDRRVGHALPPSMTTAAPSSSSRTRRAAPAHRGKQSSARRSSRHTAITRSSVIGQSASSKTATGSSYGCRPAIHVAPSRRSAA